jgi:cob(I)alamin adenosyltransferase
MKIYTKTGDRGETSLFGGRRVPKDTERIEAYGTVDELNSLIGLALLEVADAEMRQVLSDIQSTLFSVGADLATPGIESTEKIRRTSDAEVKVLEQAIDRAEKTLPSLTAFILPGGCLLGARLHLARTVCRRAERCVVRLSHLDEINPAVIVLLNRLSDLLFVLARQANHQAGIEEIRWKP